MGDKIGVEDENVRDVYEKIAGHFSDTRHDTWHWISSFSTGLSKDSLIYDIGCGNGRNMLIPNYRFVGVDTCNSFIDICRQKKLDVKYGDMTDLPFEDSTSDALIVIASFHHLSTDDRRICALKEMKRVIKDDGKILLSVWSIKQPPKSKNKFVYGDNIVKWNRYGEIFERYYYIFQIDEIKQLFSKVGLAIVEHKWDYGNEIFILQKE